MRLLTALTYYSPHVSGLTVYARRVVRRLAERGHEVTVLTSHYRSDLPRREVVDAATVLRSPVLFPVNKGVVMPLLLAQAAWLAASHDAVHLYLPQFEAGALALLAKLLRRPIVVTYGCDIVLPTRPLQLAFSPLIGWSHTLACSLADKG